MLDKGSALLVRWWMVYILCDIAALVVFIWQSTNENHIQESVFVTHIVIQCTTRSKMYWITYMTPSPQSWTKTLFKNSTLARVCAPSGLETHATQMFSFLNGVGLINKAQVPHWHILWPHWCAVYLQLNTTATCENTQSYRILFRIYISFDLYKFYITFIYVNLYTFWLGKKRM